MDTVSGKTLALADIAGSRALLVAFICNHCPYVKHIVDGFVAFAREYGPRGLAVVAISSNDVSAYPADSPGEMTRLARAKSFTFPYLYDESQAVAHAYEAACTPDFFLFDGARKLAYRGQFDGSRPGSSHPVTGADMRAAANAVLAGTQAPEKQIASVGCGIKWKASR
jgi:thiol-disulfide isomerase/thioredoxin